jgi:hypothetical protein
MAALPNGLEINADDGRIRFDIVIHEQSSSSGFPAFEDFEWLEENKVFEHEASLWRAGYWDVGGSFGIRAGIQSAICIGLAVELTVEDGTPPWDGMITTGNGVNSSDHELWDDGVFEVRYDRGYSLPAVGRYDWGIGYEITPR